MVIEFLKKIFIILLQESPDNILQKMYDLKLIKYLNLVKILCHI